MNTSTLVQKLWNYCNVLRDDGMNDSGVLLPSPQALDVAYWGSFFNAIFPMDRRLPRRDLEVGIVDLGGTPSGRRCRLARLEHVGTARATDTILSLCAVYLVAQSMLIMVLLKFWEIHESAAGAKRYRKVKVPAR